MNLYHIYIILLFYTKLIYISRYLINTNFSGVIGAIDGTHVAIWSLTKNREHLYINRKLFHSLNVMIVNTNYHYFIYYLSSYEKQ